MSMHSRILVVMATGENLPAPCNLCGGRAGRRVEGAWTCITCGWRLGDVPDPDLPVPLIDVVYYARYADRVKIGTSARPRQRLSRIRHHELLAFERGDRRLEQQRHREFAAIREGGEWFTLTGALEVHISVLRRAGDPWEVYARWLSEALRS